MLCLCSLRSKTSFTKVGSDDHGARGSLLKATLHLEENCPGIPGPKYYEGLLDEIPGMRCHQGPARSVASHLPRPPAGSLSGWVEVDFCEVQRFASVLSWKWLGVGTHIQCSGGRQAPGWLLHG